MSNWPYDEIFDQPRSGLLQQERIEYRIVRGKIIKETITRKYMGTDDYQDSVKTEVLG